ncbi:MAG: group II intron reverse transcriptase/maturase [Vulcanimicrobiota bacterium]
MVGKGRTSGGFGDLTDSQGTRRKQITRHRGWPQEVRVELRGNAGALSVPSASSGGRNNVQSEPEGLLEMILHRENLNRAFKRVKSNRGSHGIDGMTVDELLPFLKQHGETLRHSILEGTYRPSPVRRVEIPKPDGGIRTLGIATVVDRFIQQAMAQVLTQIFDKGFSDCSYGFRPGRGAHQAIEAARKHIQNGYSWTVDIDLEKFFDRVNHDRLMAMVARKVGDKRVLKLIRRYLESGIMINGIEVAAEEGTPQGGPISPLLANIMLDDLDKELEKRGHRHCRYADDCNIYVRSRKAGERVMRSITTFLEKVLKLKVNQAKSAVDRPWKRKFLGFTFYHRKEDVGIRVHPKAVGKFKEKARKITSRSNGMSMGHRIYKLNEFTTGWVNYFRIADMKGLAQKLDEWIRRRIRMGYWKQWKRVKTRLANLVRLGIPDRKAWEFANTRKGYWRVSNSPILSRSIGNDYLEKLGLISLMQRYRLAR